MCMFTFANKSSPRALVKGVERFECGSCPECLQKKSRKWALRASMEAKVSPGVMVTLTYDTYKYSDGRSFEENPPDPSLPLSIAHCQKFIKRLRKHFAKQGKKLKYIIAGERGKRTNRAHYHALLFNVTFDDLVKYKKSGRGNVIYKSRTLEKIWKHGICTVDCINLSAKVARYCTKYCAKDSGMDDTFMLFSRGIGEEMLLKLFNGLNYWIDGREYSVPREIWQKYIENKYKLYDVEYRLVDGEEKEVHKGYSRYVGIRKLEDSEKLIFNHIQADSKRESQIMLSLFDLNYRIIKHLKKLRKFRKAHTRDYWFSRLEYFEERISELEKRLAEIDKGKTFFKIQLQKLENSAIAYDRQSTKREIYFHYRDNDPLYQRYLAYWKRKSESYEVGRPSELERIHMLPDTKYWSYKQKAILAKASYEMKRDFIPPRSNIQAFLRFSAKKVHEEKSFAPLSRHYWANDTIRKEYSEEFKELNRLRRQIMESRNVIECVSPFDFVFNY